MAMITRESPGVNWRQVGLFIGLTFALTWLLDLLLWMTAGYNSQAALLALQRHRCCCRPSA